MTEADIIESEHTRNLECGNNLVRGVPHRILGEAAAVGQVDVDVRGDKGIVAVQIAPFLAACGCCAGAEPALVETVCVALGVEGGLDVERSEGDLEHVMFHAVRNIPVGVPSFAALLRQLAP